MKKSVILIICCLLAGVIFMGSTGRTQGSAFAAEELKGAQSGVITVQGTAEVCAEPDIALINFGVETAGTELAAAQAENARLTEAALKALDGVGIPFEQIQTVGYSVSPRYDYQGGTQKKTGYQVQNTLRVKLTDLERAGELIDAVTKAGANLFYGIEFGFSDQSVYYRDALIAALKAAKQKAELIAVTQGVTLGGTLSVEEQSAVGIAAYPAAQGRVLALDASAATPVASGKQTVKAAVTVVYAIQ